MDGPAVIFVALGIAHTGAREQFDQAADVRMDEVDAGRFKRLEKPARQPDGNAIVRPEAAPPTSGEADRARIVERFRFEIAKQQPRGLIVGHEGARIDVPVAGAMLMRNAPLPPRWPSGGTGERRNRVHPLAWH